MRRVVFLLLFLLALSCLAGCSEPDHNDGKCDICGKSASYSDGREEYCDEHLADAVKWYIEQGQN